MKVLHVIPSVSEVRGGPTENLRVSARALVERGVEVSVATTDDDGPNARLTPPEGGVAIRDGVTLHFFPRQTRFYSFSWPLTMWLWRHVARYDVVHIHALFNYPALAAGLIANMKRVPYILRPLGTMASWGFRTRRPWLKRLSFRLLEGPLLRRAAAVHCTSEMERDECAKYRTVVIPNPVEYGVPEQSVPGAEDTVLFLGRLDPKKGLDLLFPAFARVVQARPQAQLLIVGDGDPEYVASLRRTVAELGLGASVRFAGFLKGEARGDAWRSAAVFVLPSRTENFGISVVEAMAKGLPVVVSDQVGICGDIAARQAGVVVPCNSERVAGALLELLGDSAMRSAMGARGRAAVEELYSPASVADSLSRLYSVVCRKGGGLAIREPYHV